MKNLVFPVILMITACLFFSCTGHGVKSISYFGQQPPGNSPVLFAPDELSLPGHIPHGALTFSPDGKEVYWSVVPPKILVVENRQGAVPAVTSFSRYIIQAPFYHAASGKLYFQMAGPGSYGGIDIWSVTRNDSSWGPAVNAGSPPNSDRLESQPSLTTDGTLYYTGFYDKAEWDRGIYRCKLGDKGYRPPELLPETINSPHIDYAPWIAPDESFLLFASTRPGNDEADIRLYVSFHHKDDTWSDPVNLNRAMGFDHPSRFPALTPDGKFMTFMSEDKYYWVSSDIMQSAN